MARIIYHNLTRNILNELDLLDFMDTIRDGDVVYKTVTGDGILYPILKDELELMEEEYEEYFKNNP